MIDMRHFSYNSNINIFQQEAKWSNIEITTIRNVIKVINLRKSGLSIKLANDKLMRKINLKWKGINKTTNVLSFPNITKKFYDDNKVKYLGDIILSYETLKKETKMKNLSLQKHLSHILIHGILHLKGYTHENVNDTKLMQNEEVRILKNLNIKNPYKIK